MKKIIISILCLLFGFLSMNAQQNVGIGTLVPHSSTILDVSATDKGVRLPNVILSDVNLAAPISSPAIGLLTWNTNAAISGGSGVGFYYWDGTKLQKLINMLEGEGWKFTGNAGTNSLLHFIGTTDNQPLVFRVNNLRVGKIDPALFNTFLGAGTGINLPPGSTSAKGTVLLGDSSGFSLTTGIQNTFTGFRSGYSNTDGYHNTFIGSYAGGRNTSGFLNTFVGAHTGFNMRTGSGNTFAGDSAGYNTSTGSANTFVGKEAGLNNLASENSFFGYQSGRTNTTGSHNAFFGERAGEFNTTGTDNSFFGEYAGRGLFGISLTGRRNSAFGKVSGPNLSSGSDNSFFGFASGFRNTSGVGNTFIGDSCGFNNTVASYNTFLGWSAGFENTTGERNTHVGSFAGGANAFGSDNSTFGYGAGAFQSGNNNSFFGTNAAYGTSSTNGIHNAVFGSHGGNKLSSGSRNSFYGSHSGYNTTSGSGNVFIGDSTGHINLTGGNNTLLGAQSNLNGSSFSNATAIGYRALAGDNNVVVIGSVNGYNGATTSVNVGIGLISPARPLHVSGSSNTTGLAPMPDAIIVAEKLDDDAYLNILTNSNQTSGIGFGNESSSADGGIVYNAGSNTHDLRFRTNGNIDRVTIDNTGRMGIGTTSPTAKLDVNGTVKIGSAGSVLNTIIRTTVSITIPPTGHGESHIETITVPGAAIGASVSASPSSELQNGFVIAYARVSAANTVRVKFFNVSDTLAAQSAVSLFITVIQ